MGAGRLDPRAGTAAVILAGIGVTAFDGASQGPLFNDALPHRQDFFTGLGFGVAKALELGFVCGLLVMVGLVSLIWGLPVAGMPPVRSHPPRRPGPALRWSVGEDTIRLCTR